MTNEDRIFEQAEDREWEQLSDAVNELREDLDETPEQFEVRTRDTGRFADYVSKFDEDRPTFTVVNEDVSGSEPFGFAEGRAYYGRR